MTDHIKAVREGGVLRLAFARPEKKNAITRAMYARLADEMEAADTDPHVRVVLFEAEGDVFTAGNDMGDFLAEPPRLAGAEISPVGRFLRALVMAEKPYVAAVDGAAVGVGATMLFHCDLVAASDRATFQTPFANLALVPEAASSLVLPRIAGHQRASEMLLAGRRISAERAYQLGFVTDVVAPDALSGHARAIADDLASRAPEALRLTKRLVRGDKAEMLKRMEEEGVLFAERLQSAEFREAATAFLEKRAPDFSKTG